MTAGGRIGLSLALAFIAQFLGLMLAGAGHGWVTPLFASLLLWICLPVTFATVTPRGINVGKPFLVALAVIALLADAGLIKSTIDEGNALPFYLEINGLLGLLIVGIWLGLWLLWQAMVLRALIVGGGMR